MIALRGSADICREAGRHGTALSSYQDALRLSRQIGDPYEEAMTLTGIAETALSTHDPFNARISLRQALDIFERLGVPEAEAARTRLDSVSPDADRHVSLTARAVRDPPEADMPDADLGNSGPSSLRSQTIEWLQAERNIPVRSLGAF